MSNVCARYSLRQDPAVPAFEPTGGRVRTARRLDGPWRATGPDRALPFRDRAGRSVARNRHRTAARTDLRALPDPEFQVSPLP